MVIKIKKALRFLLPLSILGGVSLVPIIASCSPRPSKPIIETGRTSFDAEIKLAKFSNQLTNALSNSKLRLSKSTLDELSKLIIKSDAEFYSMLLALISDGGASGLPKLLPSDLTFKKFTAEYPESSTDNLAVMKFEIVDKQYNHSFTAKIVFNYEQTISVDQQFEYKLWQNEGIEELEVVNFIGQDKNISIPAYARVGNRDLSVTKIGDHAFASKGLNSVTLHDYIQVIGLSAFANNKLKKIKLPIKIKSIMPYAFWKNEISEISDFKLNKELDSISDYAFYGNRIKSIEFPYSVRKIGSGSFSKNLLQTLNLPDTINTIGKEVFSLNEISNLSLSSKISAIPESAFSNNKIKQLSIPLNITSIDRSAFAYNELKSLDLNTDIKNYDMHAFEFNEISILNLGKNTKNFDEVPWWSTLQNIDIDRDNEFYKSVDGVAFSKNGESLISYPLGRTAEKYIVPDGVVKISEWSFAAPAFFSNTLKEVVLPDSVEIIGTAAFWSRYSTSINTPPKLRAVAEDANFPITHEVYEVAPSITQIFHNSFTLKNCKKIVFPDGFASFDIKTFTITSFEPHTKIDEKIELNFKDRAVSIVYSSDPTQNKYFESNFVITYRE